MGLMLHLALRLVRICSNRDTLLVRCEELKTMLISRNYRKNIVGVAIAKALSVHRMEALKKEEREKSDRVIFVDLKSHFSLIQG